MIKGVTRRIVEIKSPPDSRFERAVLYLRHDMPVPGNREAKAMAEEYLKTIDASASSPKKGTSYRLAVAVLTLSLIVTLSALAILLVLYTKMQ